MGKLRDYAKKSTYRSQYRGGVAAARGHSTKHSTGRRRQIQGQTAARSPPPIRHHGKAHRTTLLAILHQPKEGSGALQLLLGLGWGSCTAPLEGRDSGGRWGWAEKGLCTRRHWETLTRLWPLEGRVGGVAPGQWPSQKRNGTWQNEGTDAWGVQRPCGEALIRG